MQIYLDWPAVTNILHYTALPISCKFTLHIVLEVDSRLSEGMSSDKAEGKDDSLAIQSKTNGPKDP